MAKVQLHEQIFRDAHQSILATRMRTEDMLPICEKIDQVGFFSLEVWGGATFDVPIRFLNEDPWERLRRLKEALPNTPLQMLERAMNIVAYQNYPDDIVEKFIYYAKKNGIDYFRIFDALNDLRNMEVPIKAVLDVGGHAQGCISYTISPVHTVEHFVEQLKELERMGCQSVCIKDMAGMISPKRAYDIIKGFKDAGGKVPIDLHSHCTSGMTGMAYMWACDAGVDILDTAISPISGGTGGMPTESVVAALKDTPYDTGYDLKLLIECRKYFLDVWKKYRHLHREEAMKVDPSVTVHQIPGGMLSNLVSQLEMQGIPEKYNEVLEETPRVRAELGYPPLVTPTSQVVGVQAVLNVKFGRYKVVPKQTKDYVKGMYGRPPGEIKPEIYEKILGPNWRDEIIDCRPADLLEPQFKKREEELEAMGLIKKPEDVITYALYPQKEVGIRFLKGECIPEFTSDQLPLPVTHPLTKQYIKALIPEITKEQLTLSDKPKTAIPTEYKVFVDGEPFDVKIEPTGGFVSMAEGKDAVTKSIDAIKAGMQGTILKVNVRQGDEVSKGDVVAVIESMKMENEIKATNSGRAEKVFVKEGDTVEPDNPIVLIR